MTRAAAALLLALAGAASAQPTVVEPSAQPMVVVEQPRPFGHFIGEVLTQRVLLDGTFEPTELPGAARVGVWFERRPVRIETGADGRRWFVVEYQIINAPRERAEVRLPALDLRGAGGATLAVPAWTIGLQAIASGASAPEAATLRPDRGAPLADTDTPRRRALELAAACAATLLLWAAWWVWRNRHDARQRPFARAWRELRAGETTPQAWQAMHAAFDRSAGRVLHGASLGALFSVRPEFESQRAAIERFYAQSGARFFGGTESSNAPLRELCRELRRIERRFDA